MSSGAIAIIGAGPYGLSLAAHLAARNVKHRIVGRPMHFWSQIAEAGGDRYLKSYCFGTNISTPVPGFTFADYSRPRGLETFEPCSIADFAAYGHWFHKKNVAWVEPVEVKHISKAANGFAVTLTNDERFLAAQVVLATGLSCYAHMSPALAHLPHTVATHTSKITAFASYRGKNVAVIGAGQSALEAAALLHEAGARPQLLIRKSEILWNKRVLEDRRLWQRFRSPISGLGTGPRAWALTNFPGVTHRLPAVWRTRFVQNHLPAEGAWWLRERVEGLFPVHFGTSVLEAREVDGRASLRLAVAKEECERRIEVDHVIAGTGYDIDVKHLSWLDPKLQDGIGCIARAPSLNSKFECSVSGLHFIGPASAMSFGPLFRFVVGAEYTARIVSAHLASRALSAA